MKSRVFGFIGRGVRLVFKLLLALVVSVYLLIVRTFLFLLTAVVAVYFLIGTTPVRELIYQVVSDALPGAITAATIQWGPAPWSIRVADVSIRGADGEHVITADAVEAEIDMPAEFAGLVALVVNPTAPIPIHLRSARVTGAHVIIEVDEDGAVGIERTFVPPPDPDDTSVGRGVDLQIEYALIDGASARIETPEVSIVVEGFRAASDFAVDDGHVHFLVPYATAKSGKFQLKPAYRPVESMTRF
ncbi:MAG: hypothetical protein R3F39_11870, partial [Myxococcota bacterium]